MRRQGLALRRILDRRGHPRPEVEVPPLLLEANRAFESHAYDRAASLFEQLAEQMARQAPRREPQILIQAGRSHLLAGSLERGMTLVMRALALLAGQQRWDELRRKGPRLAQFMQKRSLADQARQVKEWLQGQRVTGDEARGPAVFDLNTITPKTGALRSVRLPSHCPACGAPMDAREVEWADVSTAECAYCGAMVRSGA
jgi:hypothetical protein